MIKRLHNCFACGSKAENALKFFHHHPLNTERFSKRANFSFTGGYEGLKQNCSKLGEVEIDCAHRTLTIRSHIITYGEAADDQVTENIRAEIETMWNEPKGSVSIQNLQCRVVFVVTAEYKRAIDELEVLANTDPRNNYFRIEEYANGNISFVDGVGCNTGYFKLENLYVGSTTAAHEYGHTLGLEHPINLDYRGKGVPGIMYPRGTLVDPQYQYDPAKPAGVPGGTMHPIYRKVFSGDVAGLKLEKLRFDGGKAIAGSFTNIFHESHLV